MNRECAATITSTGNNAVVPSSSGIRLGGNHRSHCAASPAAQLNRSAGSQRRCSGRRRRTLSRNHVIEPDQPTLSASTVAGISGCSSSNARTRASNGKNDVAAGDRSYFGGAVDATAFTTVVREIPNRSAICFFGTPSAASLRINAQSSTVITLQSSSVHFSSVATDQFSSVVDTRGGVAGGRVAGPQCAPPGGALRGERADDRARHPRPAGGGRADLGAARPARRLRARPLDDAAAAQFHARRGGGDGGRAAAARRHAVGP